MGFPPNYGQERRSREIAKQRKIREKQMKRDEKSSHRKQGDELSPLTDITSAAPAEPPKEI